MSKLKLLIILSLVFLTGCTIKYNITIDSNLKFYETITITEKNDILSKYNQNLEIVPKQTFSQYKNSTHFSKYNLKEEIHDKDKTGVIVTNILSQEEYEKAITVEGLFNDVSFNKSKPYVSILFTGFKEDFFISPTPGEIDIDDIEVTIKLHNKVVEHNADKYDKDSNTYTWILSRDSVDKTIMLKIDQSSKRYDIIFKDFVNNNLVTIVILGSILLIGIVAYFVVINKNRNANKI